MYSHINYTGAFDNQNHIPAEENKRFINIGHREAN